METLSDLHDCKKSHGKMVVITVDNFGNTFCGYCHERVNYTKFLREKMEKNPEYQKLMEQVKDEKRRAKEKTKYK